MKILKNELKSKLNVRTQKNYPVEGVEFIDITPLIMQKETMNEIINKFVDELKDKNLDYILAPEARGFLFGSIVANQLNIGCIPVRKKGKLPPVAVEKTFEYEKEYGKDQMELPKLIEDTYKDKNMYIIDDIYATGNTMRAIEEAVTELDGKILGKGVVMNIVALNNDKEVFSLLDVEEE